MIRVLPHGESRRGWRPAVWRCWRCGMLTGVAAMGSSCPIGAKAEEMDELHVAVDRSRWLRGEAGGLLMDADGSKCALGWICSAARFADHELRDRCTLSHALDHWRAGGEGMPVLPARIHPVIARLRERGDVERTITQVNDSGDIDDGRREQLLAKAGEKIGVRFVFGSGGEHG